jgi:hypothetical protein
LSLDRLQESERLLAPAETILSFAGARGACLSCRRGRGFFDTDERLPAAALAAGLFGAAEAGSDARPNASKPRTATAAANSDAAMGRGRFLALDEAGQDNGEVGLCNPCRLEHDALCER